MMTKKREERYASTADLLSDLKAVAGEPPLQECHKFELAQLTAIEETGQDKTQLYVVEKEPLLLLKQPVFWVAAGAVLVNLILVVILILVLTTLP